jgi:hypothetical protein
MAIISEHEAVPPQSADVLSETPQEESVSKYVQKLLDRSKLATKEFRSQWPRNYQFVFGGRQWPIERPEWRFSEVVNFTWADIMTELSIQTDARLKVDYVPMEPSDTVFCKILKEINDYNWNRYAWHQKSTDCILDAKWVHVSHMESKWNPELENGLGDIEHVCLNPYGCYWDPLATCIEDARYFIYLEPTPTEKLKRLYPEKKDFIKPDVEAPGNMGGGQKISPDVDRLKFSLSGLKGRRPLPENNRFGGEDMTVLLRCWIKDESVEELVDEKPTDGVEVKKEYVLKRKYPKGRYLEVACNQVLEDRENGVKINGKVIPYEHGEIPIVRFVNYSMPREYMGENEVTHRMGPQIVTNYVWSFALDTMKQASNPKEVFSAANADAADRSSNEPGQKVVLADFNGYRREPGQPIPANLQGMVEMAQSLHDKVGGIHDASRGAVDTSITSGIMMDQYVEAAQIRPRLKNRNLDQSFQRLGKLDVAYYLQFYTAPRTFRLTNEMGWPEYVTFFVTEENGQKSAKMSSVVVDPQGGMNSGQTQTVPVKGIPDVQIVSASSIPFQKVQQFNRNIKLFEDGAIDQEALLDEIDQPNRQAILDRMKQAAEQQAAAQPPGGK